MKHRNKVLATICIIVLICIGLTISCTATEPDGQDIQLAKEKMQQLREVYKEVQQAETELQQSIEESERKEPLLRPTKDALKAMKDFYENDVKVGQKFQKYLNSSQVRGDAYKLYTSCKATFAHNKISELLNDPNQGKLLKKPYINYFRYMATNSNFSSQEIGFDPNDPSDERLWQNIKEIYFKRMPEEYLQRMREYYKQKGVPEWLFDYAGNMAFADAMINMYEGGLYILTPEDIRNAEKKVDNLYTKIGKIYPAWSMTRNLLADEDSPDNEAVIRAVQEHMRISPTVR